MYNILRTQGTDRRTVNAAPLPLDEAMAVVRAAVKSDLRRNFTRLVMNGEDEAGKPTVTVHYESGEIMIIYVLETAP